MTEDPFGRRGEDEGLAGVPGWLPPRAGDEPEPEPEPAGPGRPLWRSPAQGVPERPVFQQPGAPEGGFRAPASTGAGPGGKTPGSRRATTALVLAIAGLVVCPFVLSLMGIVLGRRAQKEIEAEGPPYTGRGNANAAVVVGWVGLVLGVLLAVLVLAGGLALDGDDGGSGGENSDAIFSLVAAALA